MHYKRRFDYVLGNLSADNGLHMLGWRTLGWYMPEQIALVNLHIN